MKAATVFQAGQTPQFADFREPTALPGEALVSVHASALSQFTRSRASGSHYSAHAELPAVAGSDGVGVTQDGRRVYFVLPEAPFGAMAERTRVSDSHLVEVPTGIDDITAAAIANPGMSAWVALVNRAGIKPGETVVVHGATGTAGRLAVQLAKHLGASKVIATARNAAALREVEAIGADVVIPFDLEGEPTGAQAFESALRTQFAMGVDIVIDYLWGRGAEVIMTAIAKAAEDGRPVRFIHVGASSGSDITLPGAALRSSAIMLMGSGIKSVPLPALLDAVRSVYDTFVSASLDIATQAVPLEAVEEAWNSETNRPRIVFTIGGPARDIF